MKRILSVILSLVLLVSVVVIPMTTSAYFNYAKNNYDCTVELVDKGTYAYNAGEGNLILNKPAKVYYKTADKERTAYSHPNFTYLTDGDLNLNNISGKDIAVPEGVFYDGTGFPNGYTGGNGAYDFDNAVITNYEDFVFDLGGKCEITAFINFDHQTYYAPGLYQVYVAETEEDLFTSESHVFNYQKTEKNDQGTSPKFVFNGEKKPVGRYFGIRYLAAISAPWDKNTAYALRIKELAVYGTEVMPMPADFKANGSIDLWSDGIYYEDNDTEHKTPKTAVYLTAQYKTPMKSGTNSADSTKVVLENGAVASVVSRTFYVATKDTADKLGDNFGKEDVQTKVKAITNTDSELAGYWKKSVADDNGNVNTSYGACVKNIQSGKETEPFAIRAKLVYKVGDHEHTVYSAVVTFENFSAQGAYDALVSNGNQPNDWFK